MNTHHPTPADVARMRVVMQTQREFLVECNAIADPETVDRSTVREKVQELSRSERQALRCQIQNRLADLDDLLTGDRQSFDEPYVEHEDLVDGVRIPNFHE